MVLKYGFLGEADWLPFRHMVNTVVKAGVPVLIDPKRAISLFIVRLSKD